jgi:hypothetical protein
MAAAAHDNRADAILVRHCNGGFRRPRSDDLPEIPVPIDQRRRRRMILDLNLRARHDNAIANVTHILNNPLQPVGRQPHQFCIDQRFGNSGRLRGTRTGGFKNGSRDRSKLGWLEKRHHFNFGKVSCGKLVRNQRSAAWQATAAAVVIVIMMMMMMMKIINGRGACLQCAKKHVDRLTGYRQA